MMQKILLDHFRIYDQSEEYSRTLKSIITQLYVNERYLHIPEERIIRISGTTDT
jgi:hypothetical protein